MNPRPSPPPAALDLASVVRDGGILALAGGSIALALLQVKGTWTEAFARSNTLPHGQRGVFLAALAVGVCAGVAVAVGLSMLGASSRRARGGGAAPFRGGRGPSPPVLRALRPGPLRGGGPARPPQPWRCVGGVVLV